jgi:DNA-binding NtrC family response regulator
VVREVDALDPREQRQLLESLQRAAGVQVISVAAQPLYPLVQTGRFTDALYYRLNVVYLDF